MAPGARAGQPPFRPPHGPTMANSRDKDDALDKPPPQWPDWYRQLVPDATTPGASAHALNAAWRAALNRWWDGVAAVASPQAQELLKPAVDQGMAFIELANSIGGKPASESGDDVLLRQPLLLWEQAAARMLAVEPTAERAPASHDETLHAYQHALAEYAGALRNVSAKALADVAHAWPGRQSSRRPRGELRELFDLYVDLGERRYYELVCSESFAQIGGRLINNLVECAHRGWKHTAAPITTTPADPPAPRSEHTDTPELPGSLADFGLGSEQIVAELQSFAAKLNVGVATLRNLGAIEVGTSEKEVVHSDRKLTLYRYLPTSEPTNPIPVLIVYALANRPYMMDLQPQRSLIRGLMDKGIEVYLIDWGYPDADDSKLGLDDYINGFIDSCVDRLRDRHGLDRINLLGVCQGGTFSLCYGALHSRKVRNLVLMVTPVDFHTPDNLLTTWLRHVDVDRLVDVLGNVPGELLNWAFVSMKPLRLTGQKYLDMVNLLDDEEKAKTFLRMEKWIHDSPAQAGECFRQFAKDLFQQNKLIKNELQIGERVVDLRQVTMPVLNVYATQDHIVPPDASLALEGRIGSTDYSTFSFEGGHIGIYVSTRAQREVPQVIAEWLHARCDSGPETSL
ncbi:MAG: class III poly(R)-hydroxyalkanoic acid synthase subunit PhaC, partial [Lysobacterales bacterium]